MVDEEALSTRSIAIESRGEGGYIVLPFTVDPAFITSQKNKRFCVSSVIHLVYRNDEDRGRVKTVRLGYPPFYCPASPFKWNNEPERPMKKH